MLLHSSGRVLLVSTHFWLHACLRVRACAVHFLFLCTQLKTKFGASKDETPRVSSGSKVVLPRSEFLQGLRYFARVLWSINSSSWVSLIFVFFHVVYLVTQKGNCQQSCIDFHKGECSEKLLQVGSLNKLMKCIKLVSLLLAKAMSFFVFLGSLRRVNQARGFQDMGATGILGFFQFFFQKQNLSNQLIQYIPPHTYTSSRSCAYCCRRWIQLSKWCPNSNDLSFFILLAFILSW